MTRRGGPRPPDRLWFNASFAAITLAAVLSGAWFYVRRVRATGIESLGDAARGELASLSVPAHATAAVEQRWVADEGFRAEMLVAPVGPQPCPAVAEAAPAHERAAVREGLQALSVADEDVRIEQLAAVNDTSRGNLLVAMMLGTQLVQAGRHSEAERVITQAFDSTGADEQIINAARVNASLDLDDIGVSTVVHLHHALGVARLSQSSSEPPWKSLKNVIGSVKPLARRRLLGTTRNQPVWSRLIIAAPGCAANGPGGVSLSTYDLYNNLILGYMRGKFVADDGQRSKEFARPAATYPSALRKLLLGQIERARASGWQNEAQLWALSNTEQIINERMPDDARLALSSILVIDWWTARDHCPPDLCNEDLLGDIRATRDELIEHAFRRRNVAQDQRASFAKSMVGLLASSTLDRSRVKDAAISMREWLPPRERQTLDDLVTADTARTALPKWVYAPRGETGEEPAEPPQAKLGPRAERWYAAALTDLAAAATKWAAGRPPAQQRHALIAIRQLLGTAEAPKELLDLERQRSWYDRMLMRIMAAKSFWAVVAVLVAALVWLVLLWILVHAREAWLLRKSLYNVELEHLATVDVRQGGEDR